MATHSPVRVREKNKIVTIPSLFEKKLRDKIFNSETRIEYSALYWQNSLYSYKIDYNILLYSSHTFKKAHLCFSLSDYYAYKVAHHKNQNISYFGPHILQTPFATVFKAIQSLL